MAVKAAHVTMLQRSPTYVVALPSHDALAQALRGWLPTGWAYRRVRTKNVRLIRLKLRLARSRPAQAKHQGEKNRP